MNGRDAFDDEMGFLGRIGDGDAERLLSGRSPEEDPDLGDVAAFIAASRAAVPVQPTGGAEAALVPRLAVEARAADAIGAAETATIAVPRARGWRPRLSLVARVALAVALVPVAMGGLAFAGVRLPEPAREGFELVGIGLPNQTEDEASGAGGKEAGDGKEARSGLAEGEGSRASEGSTGRDPAERGENVPSDGHGGRPDRPSGGGNTPPTSQPGETGSTGVPPGQGGTPPGQSSPPPGQGGTPPGQGGAIPGSGSGGQSAAPHGGGPPGGIPPGQAKPE